MNEEVKKFREKVRKANRKTENKIVNAEQINSIREYGRHLNDLIKQQNQQDER